jgi:hypothetical protein
MLEDLRSVLAATCNPCHDCVDAFGKCSRALAPGALMHTQCRSLFLKVSLIHSFYFILILVSRLLLFSCKFFFSVFLIHVAQVWTIFSDRTSEMHNLS